VRADGAEAGGEGSSAWWLVVVVMRGMGERGRV
jgi:hypothetical protein